MVWRWFSRECKIKARGSGLLISQEPFLFSFVEQALGWFLIDWFGFAGA